MTRHDAPETLCTQCDAGRPPAPCEDACDACLAAAAAAGWHHCDACHCGPRLPATARLCDACYEGGMGWGPLPDEPTGGGEVL